MQRMMGRRLPSCPLLTQEQGGSNIGLRPEFDPRREWSYLLDTARRNPAWCMDQAGGEGKLVARPFSSSDACLESSNQDRRHHIPRPRRECRPTSTERRSGQIGGCGRWGARLGRSRARTSHSAAALVLRSATCLANIASTAAIRLAPNSSEFSSAHSIEATRLAFALLKCGIT